MLDATSLGKVIEQLLAEYQVDRERLEMIDGWARGKRSDLYIPQGATAEYRQLVEQSKFNVLPLVVNALAQNLFVDGYRPTGESGRAPSSDNSPIWDRLWQPNRMDGRQGAIYRSAIKFGYSYATVTPNGETPVITPYSPLTLIALYEDRINDEWPQHAMVIRRPPGKRDGVRGVGSEGADVGTKLTVFDDEFIYEVERGVQGWEAQGQAVRHAWGVCPVIRFLDEADADDLPEGKVWPLLPAQKQLNQTTFNLAMAGQFGAFMQRWVTGMTDEEPQFRARIDAMLRSDSVDTKFGQFDATPLDGYLSARDKVLLYVSSVAQIPPHNLLVGAGISNISAEALAALEAGHRHDIQEHQTSFGESIEQMLRLAGRALGSPDGDEAWDDTSAQVVWRDTTPRSLAQVADALGKMAQQLGIPVQALWEWLPGVTDQDIARWIDMANEDELMGELKTLVGQESQRLQQEEPGAVPEGEPAHARTPA
jgi:hypothetical protein